MQRTLPKDPVSTFKCVFKDQQMASGMLSQPSRYKNAESNLLADEKVPNRGIQTVVWLYIYTVDFLFGSAAEY